MELNELKHKRITMTIQTHFKNGQSQQIKLLEKLMVKSNLSQMKTRMMIMKMVVVMMMMMMMMVMTRSIESSTHTKRENEMTMMIMMMMTNHAKKTSE